MEVMRPPRPRSRRIPRRFWNDNEEAEFENWRGEMEVSLLQPKLFVWAEPGVGGSGPCKSLQGTLKPRGRGSSRLEKRPIFCRVHKRFDGKLEVAWDGRDVVR
jgi:hypothetical protein